MEEPFLQHLATKWALKIECKSIRSKTMKFRRFVTRATFWSFGTVPILHRGSFKKFLRLSCESDFQLNLQIRSSDFWAESSQNVSLCESTKIFKDLSYTFLNIHTQNYSLVCTIFGFTIVQSCQEAVELMILFYGHGSTGWFFGVSSESQDLNVLPNAHLSRWTDYSVSMLSRINPITL